MPSFLLRRLCFRIFLGIFSLLPFSNAFAMEEGSCEPSARPCKAHVLMPAHNAKPYIKDSVQSVLAQNHPSVRLLIVNDGSTDGTSEDVVSFQEKYPNKITTRSHPENLGVAATRSTLLQLSKQIDPDAYLFWLDADDIYTDPSFVRDAIDQMQKTKADVCLVNFSIIYQDPSQISNAAGLRHGQERHATVLDFISSTPEQVLSPLALPRFLDITGLGWVKVYAPWVVLPEPLNYPFEDFVYMAALLNVERITALPSERKPIQYLRRSDSICGQRSPENFEIHIPDQQQKFFDTVDDHSRDQKDRVQKLKVAEELVLDRLHAYATTLDTILERGTHPTVTQATKEAYNKKAGILRQHVRSVVEKAQEVGVSGNAAQSAEASQD